MCAPFENANINRRGAEAFEAPAPQSRLAETDLIQRLQEGPETAYREFVERYQADVYRIAFGIIGRRNDADGWRRRFLRSRISSSNDSTGLALSPHGSIAWLSTSVTNFCAGDDAAPPAVTTQPVRTRCLMGPARGETSSTNYWTVFRKRIATCSSCGNSKVTP